MTLLLAFMVFTIQLLSANRLATVTLELATDYVLVFSTVTRDHMLKCTGAAWPGMACLLAFVLFARQELITLAVAHEMC